MAQGLTDCTKPIGGQPISDVMTNRPNFFMSHLHNEEEVLPFVAVADDEVPAREDHFSDVLPVMPLKNTVLFPGVIIPITVGREKSMRAVSASHDADKYILVLTQVNSQTEEPGSIDLYQTGTVAKVVKLLKMPDGSQTVILQGRKRCLVTEWVSDEPFLKARISKREHIPSTNKIEYEAMIQSVMEKSKRIVELMPQIPNEAQVLLKNINDDRFLLHFISSNLNLPIQKKQELLEMDELHKKAETLLFLLNNELQMLEVKDQIEARVRMDLEKQQRDYYLNQQLKTIQEELGQDPVEQDVEDIVARA